MRVAAQAENLLNPMKFLENMGKVQQGMQGIAKNAAEFAEKLCKFPPDLMGAANELKQIMQSAQRACDGLNSLIPGLQMKPEQLLGGAGGAGGSGGASGAGGPCGAGGAQQPNAMSNERPQEGGGSNPMERMLEQLLKSMLGSMMQNPLQMLSRS